MTPTGNRSARPGTPSGAEPRAVVAGVDHSADSNATAEWALAEARSRGVPLRLVYAYSDLEIYSRVYSFGSLTVPEPAEIWAAAESFIGQEAERLQAISPGVQIDATAVDADPVPALLEQARNACVVVLGSRHVKALGAGVLGSVSTSVAALAACPVVVLRRSEAPRNAGVVIGVHPGGDGDATAAFAFDYAARLQLPLHVIMCLPPGRPVEMLRRQSRPSPEQARAELTSALDAWREKYPDVDVTRVVDCGHPVDALIAASAGRDLLVVGAHGRHSIAGSFLGSVSQGVLHHALCPVAVVGSA